MSVSASTLAAIPIVPSPPSTATLRAPASTARSTACLMVVRAAGVPATSMSPSGANSASMRLRSWGVVRVAAG